jgi:hypothetical protein
VRAAVRGGGQPPLVERRVSAYQLGISGDVSFDDDF